MVQSNLLGQAQAVHYDSGYTWRGYAGTIAPTCQQKLCKHYAMHAWDSYYTEFTGWKSTSGQSNTAFAFLNFRVIFPPGYNVKDQSKRYPVIVLMHGAGESGRVWTDHFNYDPSDPKYDNSSDQLKHGGNEHRLAVAKPAADAGSFPGIVVFPQVSYSATWGDLNSATISDSEDILVRFILEQIVGKYHGDINRVVAQGISTGGRAMWSLAIKRPDIFAAILPMSAVPQDFEKASTVLLTTPLRIFQGGTDTNPAPSASEDVVEAFEAKGGKPKRFFYSSVGHDTWNYAFKEPDFFGWIKAQDKRNVFLFGVAPEFCEKPTKLGFSPNMSAYQWQRNGVDVIGGTAQYLEVMAPGVYKVKFERPDGSSDVSFPITVSRVVGCTVTAVADDPLALSVYPNPTSGDVIVSSREPINTDGIELFSILGQPALVTARQISDKSIALDLSSQSRGVYILVFKQTGQRIKLVRE